MSKLGQWQSMGAILDKRKDKRGTERECLCVYEVRRAEPSGLLHLGFNTLLIAVVLVHEKRTCSAKRSRKTPIKVSL